MSDDKRRYLSLPDGRALALPAVPNIAEFALPGNFREYTAGRFYALFDDETGTGAIYYWDHQTWHLVQPYTRTTFELHCAMLMRMAPALQAAQGLVDAAAARH